MSSANDMLQIIARTIPDDYSLSTGDIVHFEHINLVVGDQRLAEIFYFFGLGLNRDPRMADRSKEVVWANCGRQQFHLVSAKYTEPPMGPQVIDGAIGITISNLEGLKDRLSSIERDGQLVGTRFQWASFCSGNKEEVISKAYKR